MNVINLIFIGDRFYRKSGSCMSSIYSVEGLRFDWGLVTVFYCGHRNEQHRPHLCADLHFVVLRGAQNRSPLQSTVRSE